MGTRASSAPRSALSFRTIRYFCSFAGWEKNSTTVVCSGGAPQRAATVKQAPKRVSAIPRGREKQTTSAYLHGSEIHYLGRKVNSVKILLYRLLHVFLLVRDYAMILQQFQSNENIEGLVCFPITGRNIIMSLSLGMFLHVQCSPTGIHLAMIFVRNFPHFFWS